MRRWVPLALAIWLPGGLLAQATATVVLEVPAAGIAFGAPFALRLERHWPAGWTPAPIDETAWAPLLVEVVSAAVERGADGGYHERREYRARATARGELPEQPIVQRWRDAGGGEHTVVMVRPALRVRSVLPAPPGEIEWAGPVRDLPAAVLWWWFAALAAGVLAGFRFVQRRRRAVGGAAASATVIGSPPPPVDLEVLAALQALPLPAADAGDDVVLAFYATVKARLRDYFDRGAAVPAFVRTSEELQRAAAGGREPLAACLRACDAVLFAARRPRLEEHAAARDAALQFVRATAWGSAPAVPA